MIQEPTLKPVERAVKTFIYEMHTAWRASQPHPTPRNPFAPVIHGMWTFRVRKPEVKK